MPTIPDGPYFTDASRALAELLVINSESLDNERGQEPAQLRIVGYPVAVMKPTPAETRAAFMATFERILTLAGDLAGWRLTDHTITFATVEPYSTEPVVTLTFWAIR